MFNIRPLEGTFHECQVFGAILGAFLTAFLLGDGGPGCFDCSVIPADVSDKQVGKEGNHPKGDSLPVLGPFVFR